VGLLCSHLWDDSGFAAELVESISKSIIIDKNEKEQ